MTGLAPVTSAMANRAAYEDNWLPSLPPSKAVSRWELWLVLGQGGKAGSKAGVAEPILGMEVKIASFK